MGRKALPVNVILAEGNKSHLTKAQIEARQEAEASLKFGVDKIVCPDWMPDEGRYAWGVITDELRMYDLVTNVDIFGLSIACDAYAKYVQASKAIGEDLILDYTNKAGATNKVANPNVAIAQKYHQIFKSYLAEFGLSPAARNRLTLQKDDEGEDEFEKEFGQYA